MHGAGQELWNPASRNNMGLSIEVLTRPADGRAESSLHAFPSMLTCIHDPRDNAASARLPANASTWKLVASPFGTATLACSPAMHCFFGASSLLALGFAGMFRDVAGASLKEPINSVLKLSDIPMASIWTEAFWVRLKRALDLQVLDCFKKLVLHHHLAGKGEY